MASHRMSKSKEYRAWLRMKGCCYNKNINYYQKYGARGINMCDEWKDDFSNFIEDMGPMPAECNGLQLIDETKDFCKANCRWERKKQGAPIRAQKKELAPKNKSKLKNPKPVYISLEREMLDFIKSLALKMSIEQGVYIEPNDLIREALAKAFPTQQYDMFGKEIKK